MLIRCASFAFAAALCAAPVAMAQQNNPAGNLGSNRSTTAAPGTADNHSASGVNTGDVHSGSSTYSGSGMSSGSTTSSTTPGATGHTVVPGNNSSVAQDSRGTNHQASGNASGAGGGAAK